MTTLAWHFTAQPSVLANTGEAFTLGQTLCIDGEIEPCSRGFHGSPTVLQALEYAPGPHLYRVELTGTVKPHGHPTDKYAASERTALAYQDATPLLRLHARQCALDVFHLWREPPAIVREYLLTGDESKRDAACAAARDAARDAAWDAARDAACAAARAAACAAARAAACAAARDAARDAAWAARAAAWAAAWDAACAAARDAAWDAACAAARAAARDAACARLERWALAFIATGVLPEIEVPA